MVNCIEVHITNTDATPQISTIEVPLNSKQSQNSVKKTFRTPFVKTFLKNNGKTVNILKEFLENPNLTFISSVILKVAKLKIILNCSME